MSSLDEKVLHALLDEMIFKLVSGIDKYVARYVCKHDFVCEKARFEKVVVVKKITLDMLYGYQFARVHLTIFYHGKATALGTILCFS